MVIELEHLDLENYIKKHILIHNLRIHKKEY